MKIIYNVRHRYAIRLKFADESLTFLTTSVFGNILLYRRKFSAFIVVDII